MKKLIQKKKQNNKGERKKQSKMDNKQKAKW